MIKHIALYIALFVILTGFSGSDDKKKGNQHAYYECTDPIDIDSTLFVPRAGKVYFQFDPEKCPTSKEFNQFIWYENLKVTDYFTAYLVNTSDSSFGAKRQDGSLIMIQEALNEDGKWMPIEYWVYSGCGNSYFDPLDLSPGKYVMIPIRKYEGNFETQIRLRFLQGKHLYYSESFKAKIDKSQFERETENVHGILYHGKANYLERDDLAEPVVLN
ncbi:MAG: hypothetical protein ACO1N0_16540 [Fluviicola sp.]